MAATYANGADVHITSAWGADTERPPHRAHQALHSENISNKTKRMCKNTGLSHINAQLCEARAAAFRDGIQIT